MASHSYTILPEQAQEDALHAARLLHVEERPFQRVSQRLLGKDSLLKSTPLQLPSPPPEGAETETTAEPTENEASRHQKFREDILLDFAALESSILRIQLIQSSNARERERYAAEKAKILATAQAVRDNTVSLRTALSEAQTVLELRKGYDELAAKLIDSRKLKSRGETREDISKLEKEIEDLEQESSDFEGVWVGRREAFDRVVGEGRNLFKVIKGIKDEPEPEKDEAMDEGEEWVGTKGERSRMGTPQPGDGTPMPGERTPMVGGSTPLPEDLGSRTPMGESGEGEERAVSKFLDVEGMGSGTGTSSQVESPALHPEDGRGDVEMGEEQVQLDDGEADANEVMEMETVEEPEQVATPAENMDES